MTLMNVNKEFHPDAGYMGLMWHIGGKHESVRVGDGLKSE